MEVSGFLDNSSHKMESVMARGRLLLELFSRVFLESVGAEPKSILYELGGFEVREQKFRKEMETNRTNRNDDLCLNVDRARNRLIAQTFTQLNQHFRNKSAYRQPLAVIRVKVTFRNEPGEGTGVARSFYTAIAEELRSSLPLPTLDPIVNSSSTSSALSGSQRKDRAANQDSNDIFPPFLLHRMFRRDRGAAGSGSLGSGGSETSLTISTTPFFPRGNRRAARPSTTDRPDRNKQAIGERLYPKVETSPILAQHQSWVPKICGMLLRLPSYELLLLLRADRSLEDRINEGLNLLQSCQYNEEDDSYDDAAHQQLQQPSSGAEPKHDDSKNSKDEETDDAMESESQQQPADNKPLFFEPAKGKGFLAPAMFGSNVSDVRLNAYRNVGRLMGLCLLQNELFPLPLCRHVIKVILGRKVNWHDFAFYDAQIYDNLRQLVKLHENKQDYGYDSNFIVDLQAEEGAGQVELVANGENINVTSENARDYVRRYSIFRMLLSCKPALDMMRSGVLDVVPSSSLDDLTPEDFRLLINGCEQVDVQTLITYTKFSDEVGKSQVVTNERLTEFKKWFWTVVHRLDNTERQELLFFWTGSPALPASEDGFQPLPSITIRPPSDQMLPTANTCISKLYLPLYSNRQILQRKLCQAIKTKSFGFV